MGPKLKKIIALCSFVFILQSSRALAAPENDRVYQLDTVGWLKASDNADGVFADYLDDQYSRFFGKQTHFVVRKLKNLDELLGKSKEKYNELIQQAPLLKKVAQKYRLENLIRTRVYKENDTYRFVMEWVYAPKGDVLSTVEFRYADPRKEEGLEKSEMPAAIEKGLDDLIDKLPFLGQITGIEGDTLTVNLGHDQELGVGDTLILSTIQSVKRHPILKTVEEWRWQAVGRARVEQVEESLAFAKMIETEPGQQVIRYQKIREIIPAPPEPLTPAASEKHDIPRSGWMAANLGLGDYARDVGLPNGISGRTGGGLLETFEVDAQIWFNSRFIAQGSFMGSLFNYAPKDLSTGSELPGTYHGSGSQFRIAGGYSLFTMKSVFDSIAWVHAGYKSTHYSLPASSDYTGNADFGSFFIGIGGQVQLQDRFGAQLGIDLGLLRSISQTNLSFGDPSASTDLCFNVAGTYRYTEQVQFRVLMKLNSQAMDFPGGESVSQKMFSVAPSIMYYF